MVDTNKDPQKTDKKENVCPVCIMAPALGIGTGMCQVLPDKEQRKNCDRILADMSSNKIKAEEALANILVLVGEENANKILREINETIKKASSIAAKKIGANATTKLGANV